MNDTEKRLRAELQQCVGDQSGEHLILACRELVRFSSVDEGRPMMALLLKTDPYMLALLAGALAQECVNAAWVPQGDLGGES